MSHGKEKAQKENLNYYIVTNCISEFRFYNSYSDEEIQLDGTRLTKPVSIILLQKIQTQVKFNNSSVIHKSTKKTIPLSPTKFRTTLKNLADIYRSAGLKKGDDRIDPTISFVVLKYVSEKEQEQRSLNEVIKLWNVLHKIAIGEEIGDLRTEFNSMIEMIWGNESQYKNNTYKDFKDLIILPVKLKNEHVKKIYLELNHYHFHGVNFDLFGSIYEEFATQTKKKDFGEFYTRRHITSFIAKLLLRNELTPTNNMKICDPACGSGGFLTECFITLLRNYSIRNKLNVDTEKDLKEKIFYGYDNDEKSVARTKLNMFLVGDGHIHIYENDSLTNWNPAIKFQEDEFDYVITNPPMGPYEGEAKIEDFNLSNEKRYEFLFLEQVVRITRRGGEIAIVVNDGMLETPSRKDLRKKLLKNCKIHAIVSLTRFAFAPYTKEKTYVIFMQKKQDDDVGKIQTTPIWHFILDYDGYANSDKRYRTKYHDDISELENNFPDAINLSMHPSDSSTMKEEYLRLERSVNEREKLDGLSGYKHKFVDMKNVNEDNFFNLLSEYHLRPHKTKQIPKNAFNKKLQAIKLDLEKLIEMI